MSPVPALTPETGRILQHHGHALDIEPLHQLDRLPVPPPRPDHDGFQLPPRERLGPRNVRRHELMAQPMEQVREPELGFFGECKARKDGKSEDQGSTPVIGPTLPGLNRVEGRTGLPLFVVRTLRGRSSFFVTGTPRGRVPVRAHSVHYSTLGFASRQSYAEHPQSTRLHMRSFPECHHRLTRPTHEAMRASRTRPSDCPGNPRNHT